MENRESLTGPARMLFTLVRATNAHDLDAVVDCFASDYRNETPAHPARSFRGSEQVKANWQQIFAGVPDIKVTVVSSAIEGSRVWAELEMSGRRRDGSPHLLRGVVIFEVEAGKAVWARFYMEPVQEDGGDVNDAVRSSIAARLEASR